MKNKLFLTITTAAMLVIAGCATKSVTTSTNPTTGVTTSQTNYQANVTAVQAATVATQVAPVVATVNPLAGLIVGLVGLLLGGGASAVAVAQNAKANLHQSTLQAVVTGIENAIPSIQSALGTVTASGVAPGANQSLTTATTVLGAIKQSISAAATANGTQANLNTQLASAGIGPTAS